MSVAQTRHCLQKKKEKPIKWEREGRDTEKRVRDGRLKVERRDTASVLYGAAE